MSSEGGHKVTTAHLRRSAYLYVRQSTLRQVAENQESTRRQYDLRQRAVALGWPTDSIIVVDEDQGQSGASRDREGFRRLVADVGMGQAGIVMSLEVSRLARSSSEWHRLLEICALSQTLILDEEGIYDPTVLNDRILLGLKGTMSEVEYWMIRSRLVGGMKSKARRGELRVRLPVGFVYDWQDQVVLDPDQRVQDTVRRLFASFRREGTAYATLRSFQKERLEFPRRMHSGPRKGDILWGELTYGRTVEVLHNPRYAGAFVYGRRSQQANAGGQTSVQWLPREDWHTLIPSAHEGYITWEAFEENQRKLEANTLCARESRSSPPREGPALLQGLVVCGVCGKGMSVRYHRRRGELIPDYVCQGLRSRTGTGACQSISGAAVDKAIGELLVHTMSPVALEVALAVQEEVQARIDEADQLRAKRVEAARYEAELARQRFILVDPRNRLVADTLEAEWNEKLRAAAEAEQDYQRRRLADRKLLGPKTRDKILELASDFATLWNDPKTAPRDRKRMARLLLEDVTLIKQEGTTLQVRFRGGASRILRLPRALKSWEQWQTDPEVVAKIDQLLETNTPGEVASILNKSGFVSGQGKVFHGSRIGKILRAYGLKSRLDRLRERGLLTARELGERYGVHHGTVRKWRARGHLVAYRADDTGQHLYEDPGKRPSFAARGARQS